MDFFAIKKEEKFMAKNLTSSQAYHKILKDVNSMPERDLLKQEGYYNLLDSVAVSMLRKGEKPIHLQCSSTKSNETGCTDGNNIFINTWSPIVLKVEEMDKYIRKGGSDDWASLLPKNYNVRHLMYLVNIGTVAHEFGHVMYTDFTSLNSMKERFARGSFVGCANKDKLEKLASDYRFSNPLIHGIFDLINIVEDCYIENCLCLDYPRRGNVVRGLETGNLIKFFTSISTVELEDKVMSGHMLLSDAFNWLLQIRDCLGYEPKDYARCVGPIHEILSEVLDRALPICESYKTSSHNHEDEIYQLVDIFSELFPDPEILDQMMGEGEGEGEQSNESGNSNQQQNGGGNGQDNKNGGSNSNSGNSEEQKKRQEIMKAQQASAEHDKAREEARENSGQSNDSMFARARGSAKRNPTRDNSAEAQEEAQAEANEARQSAKNNSVVDEDIAKEIAEEILAEQKANAQASELQSQYERTRKLLHTESYPSARVTKMRMKGTPDMKRAYDDIYRNVDKTAKTCIRKVSQILDKREYEEEESGFVQGFKFNAHEAYRRDRKCFSKQIVPDSKPDVSFSIMVDESGSMNCDHKYLRAREAAILFDAISRGLDIPAQIIGHTTSGYHPIVKLYRNFDSDEKEKYALTQIEADSGNVDTVILTGLCEQMLERPEEKKVVIVISDGAPCALTGDEKASFNGTPIRREVDGYRGGNYASRELNACVRHYRKKGVKIIGIAIDDLEDIKGIYEEGTLDCTDLDKLPNELVKIFKRYVLK